MSVWFVGATVATAAIGAYTSSESARKGRNAAQRVATTELELASQQLDAQVQQADDLLAFNRQAYEEGRDRQVGVDAVNRRVIDQQLRVSQDNADRATDSYEFYQRTGRPVVEQAINDAQNFDSQENINLARGRAVADVSQGFASAQSQTQRALSRMGINPNSGKFLALQQRLQTEKAGALAGAANQAEEGRRQGGAQARLQAANLAQGFPAQAIGQNGAGTSAGNSAVNANSQSAAQSLALTGQALQGMQAGAGIYGQAAQGYGNLASSAFNRISSIDATNAQSQAGWGSLAGAGFSALSNRGSGGGNLAAPTYSTDIYGGGNGMADGGKVTGPGTGTSDSVPAVNKDTGGRVMLSNGEWVVPADVVKAVGTKFLQTLTDKHHKPVNLRSAA